jgi:hypothetical protein
MLQAGGPYLTVAVLCERVLQEQDGVLSAIRIIDRLIRVSAGPSAPGDMEPFSHVLAALVCLKSGQARGRFTLTIRAETPSGQQLDALSLPVQLGGEDQGANLIINIPFTVEHEGLYWFDVMLEDELITRMPLRVIYQPHPASVGRTSP